MPVPASITDLSTNPASNYPSGSEPVFPNLDNYLRAHASFIAQLRDRLNAEGLPLAAVLWWGGARASIAARMRALDGQILNRADFPALWAFVAGGGYPLVSESEWLTAPLRRSSFSSGDGASTFRMPDMNGKAASSIGAVTLRGDGAFSAGAAGLMQDGQNLSHGHGASSSQDGAHSHAVSGSTSVDGGHSHGVPDNDAFPGSGNAFDSGGKYPFRYLQTTSEGVHSHSVSASASAAGTHMHAITVSVDGGSEARMKSATGAWVMRVL